MDSKNKNKQQQQQNNNKNSQKGTGVPGNRFRTFQLGQKVGDGVDTLSLRKACESHSTKTKASQMLDLN